MGGSLRPSIPISPPLYPDTVYTDRDFFCGEETGVRTPGNLGVRNEVRNERITPVSSHGSEPATVNPYLTANST